ncbi:hypothetical protein BU14_1992s0002 [Porphyra umbilicalis]|uniref:Uncharacterized protein n=1 Tax=Porphyra umbilicalis TaxID=2786 RepID=A0A1X6NK45_PORUM|nr:hypothetical protein BU14_1992s0002 [Porphyra umbilicalis]|eukprot:OSX68991.1 hypothetical protein BU14_1992s0002 [Porphyra umbilicalis]
MLILRIDARGSKAARARHPNALQKRPIVRRHRLRSWRTKQTNKPAAAAPCRRRTCTSHHPSHAPRQRCARDRGTATPASARLGTRPARGRRPQTQAGVCGTAAAAAAVSRRASARRCPRRATTAAATATAVAQRQQATHCAWGLPEEAVKRKDTPHRTCLGKFLSNNSWWHAQVPSRLVFSAH